MNPMGQKYLSCGILLCMRRRLDDNNKAGYILRKELDSMAKHSIMNI